MVSIVALEHSLSMRSDVKSGTDVILVIAEANREWYNYILLAEVTAWYAVYSLRLVTDRNSSGDIKGKGEECQLKTPYVYICAILLWYYSLCSFSENFSIYWMLLLFIMFR